MAKKSVKGYSRLMKSLTTNELYDMDKKELERFLSYESKLIEKNMMNLIESGLGDYSPLMTRRMQNNRPLPRRITLKEAKKMTIQELRAEITELSYIAKSKTGDVRGMKKYLKQFKETTGRDPSELSSSDWAEIRKKIEESAYDSNDIIASYSEQGDESDQDFQNAWDMRIKANEYARYEREQAKASSFKMR